MAAELNLACNALQVVGVALKVASKCKSVYLHGVTNDEGLTEADAHARAALQDLHTLVQASSPSCDQALRDEASRISIEASRLQSIADEIQGKGKASKGKVAGSARTVWKATWKRKEIMQLEKGLQTRKGALETRLLSKLHTQLDAVTLQQTSGFPDLDPKFRSVIDAIADGQTKLEQIGQKISKQLATDSGAVRDAILADGNKTRQQLSLNAKAAMVAVESEGSKTREELSAESAAVMVVAHDEGTKTRHQLAAELATVAAALEAEGNKTREEVVTEVTTIVHDEGVETRQQLSTESALVTAVVEGEGRKTRKVVVDVVEEVEDIVLSSVGVHAQAVAAMSRDVRDHVASVVDLVGETEKVREEHRRLINSLVHPNMGDRRIQIQAAHPGTFQWCFGRNEESNINHDRVASSAPRDDAESLPEFPSWLRSPDAKLAWVKGKAGCGKSTLMKFLAEDPRTVDSLDAIWPRPLILPHFLWSGGHLLECSIRGILLSLLHQVLSVDSRLATTVLKRFPAAQSRKSINDWSDLDLQETLLFVLEALNRPVCIFIDGLDEIDRSDGPHKVINFIKCLIDRPLLKLCVSSRPEPALKKYLEEFRILQVQDFTSGDIRRFVGEELQPFFTDRPEELSSFVDAIANKSEGVFLWVSMALKSLKEGLDSEDDDLMARLEDLPGDLNRLYQDMWDRQNANVKAYRVDCAVYLNTFLSMRDSDLDRMHFWIFAFLTRPSLLESAFQRHTLSEESIRLLSTLDTQKRNVENRCGGLLEISTIPGVPAPENGMEVKLIHRSAIEFLRNTAEGRRILSYDTSTPLDRNTALAKTSLIRAQLGDCDAGFHGYFRHVARIMREPNMPRAVMTMLLDFAARFYDEFPVSPKQLDIIGHAARVNIVEFAYEKLVALKERAPRGVLSKEYLAGLFMLGAWSTRVVDVGDGDGEGVGYGHHWTEQTPRNKFLQLLIEYGMDFESRQINWGYALPHLKEARSDVLYVRATPFMLMMNIVFPFRSGLEGAHYRRARANLRLMNSVHFLSDVDAKTILSFTYHHTGATSRPALMIEFLDVLNLANFRRNIAPTQKPSQSLKPDKHATDPPEGPMPAKDDTSGDHPKICSSHFAGFTLLVEVDAFFICYLIRTTVARSDQTVLDQLLRPSPTNPTPLGVYHPHEDGNSCFHLLDTPSDRNGLSDDIGFALDLYWVEASRTWLPPRSLYQNVLSFVRRSTAPDIDTLRSRLLETMHFAAEDAVPPWPEPFPGARASNGTPLDLAGLGERFCAEVGHADQLDI